MAPALQQAVEAGIPVVTIDRRVDGVPGILAHVGADNVKGGEAQGELIMELFPDGANDHQPAGPARRQPGDRPQQGRAQRARPAQDKYQFVFEQTANFARDRGPVGDRSRPRRHGQPPDVIVAANDDMALGAIEARQGPRPHRQSR